MAVNPSGIDEDEYLLNSTILNLFLFLILVLPPLLLCLLCMIALIFANFNNRKITVLLINIFVAETTSWVSYTAFYLGFPARLAKLPGDFSCYVSLISFGIGGTQRFTSITLYAIMVYISIKYGEKGLKWWVILPCVLISWVVTVVLITTVLFLRTSQFEPNNTNGFCGLEQGPMAQTIAAVAVRFLILPGVCLIVTITFCVLTFVYIKKNTLEGNVPAKKAGAKLILYFSITLAFSFLGIFGPVVMMPIKNTISESGLIIQLAVDHTVRGFFLIPPFTTPIVAIVLLKPLRAAFLKVYCKCCRGGAENQAPQQPNRMQQEPAHQRELERKGSQNEGELEREGPQDQGGSKREGHRQQEELEMGSQNREESGLSIRMNQRWRGFRIRRNQVADSGGIGVEGDLAARGSSQEREGLQNQVESEREGPQKQLESERKVPQNRADLEGEGPQKQLESERKAPQNRADLEGEGPQQREAQM